MNFRCHSTRELLESLEDGELEPRQKARVLHHLARCTECRALHEANARALSATRAALAGHPRIAAPVGFDARVWKAIEQRRGRPQTLRSRLGAWATRPVPRLLGSACFGLSVALALGGAAPPDGPAPRIAVAQAPLDAEGSLAVLIAIEQHRGPLGLRFHSQAELQVLAPEPQHNQQPNQQPASQRRSQENSWTRPARASQGASSSDAGWLC